MIRAGNPPQTTRPVTPAELDAIAAEHGLTPIPAGEHRYVVRVLGETVVVYQARAVRHG